METFLLTLYNMCFALLTNLQGKIEELMNSEEPLSFYQKSQLDFLKQCRLLDIDVNCPEAEKLRTTLADANNTNNAFTNNFYDEVI